MANLIFFLTSLLQSSESHDPSEVILIYLFGAQKTFLTLMLKTIVLLDIFVETVIIFSFFQDSLLNKMLKSAAFF